MPEHYPTNVKEVLVWCDTCGRKLQKYVDRGGDGAYNRHTNYPLRSTEMAQRHSYTLSDRHEKILQRLAKKLDASFVNVLERALESLEEQQAQRDRIVKDIEI